ncbi:MAG TPA: glycine oxidase ThiO [Mycobacteriales bacterium]|nr:glycine oxidase ThiO [Mycobacteriales bacterium]
MDGHHAADVVVVGAGVIGLAVAWRAACHGLRVTAVDPAPGLGASHVAAGMLAPVTELGYGEQDLLALNLVAASRYPSFVAEVEDAAGLSCGYRQSGTLAVAADADDRAELAALHEFQRSLGLAAQWLTGRECRALEPLLAPSVTGGLLVDGDHQVDGRRLAAALLVAADRAGVVLHRGRASVTVRGDRVTGVRLPDGTALPAGTVVLAAGCWSGQVDGLPAGALPPVRPVKGQILRLRVPPRFAPFLSRTVRGNTGGSHVYLVPREDGELVVGATSEERGFDTQVTAGAVYELLRDAHDLVPGLGELPLVETIAGLRPGSPDNAPVLGPGALDGLVLATGHHRNGILLTSVTAEVITELLVTGRLPELAAPFTLDRFGGAPAGREVPA